jgi:hypothetical protein
MLDPKHLLEKQETNTSILKKKSTWIETMCSGLLHDQRPWHLCEKRNRSPAMITDPQQGERK